MRTSLLFTLAAVAVYFQGFSAVEQIGLHATHLDGSRTLSRAHLTAEQETAGGLPGQEAAEEAETPEEARGREVRSRA